MQDKARDDLARLFSAELDKAGLRADAIVTFATPRRLALIARDLPTETEATSEERKGPRADAPAQALEGFLRSTGLTRDQLEERDDGKGNKVLFAVTQKPGRATAAVLAEAIPAIIRAFPWPKSMRWGDASLSTESLRWVRPLQGIVALLGDDVVPFEIEGVVSGAETVGHRFHHPDRVTIGNADDYAMKLRACHVLVDPREREAIIRDGATAAAAEAGLALVPDEGLVAENAGLTEWPVPLLGSFDPAFLQVPREVIQLTMRTNQKYFAVNDAAGHLAPNFICTANIVAADGGALIVSGNAKVLAARLSDAKFFWEQDLKIPLETQAEKLGQIVFHEKLGTVADKVDRVAKLARWLVEEGIVHEGSNPALSTAPNSVGVERSRDTFPDLALRPSTSLGTNGELADMAETAARLCKADLVTGMVGEFPELQGVMGGYYARAQGLPDAVADAIRDHYKPVGQGDDVPTTPVTVAVSLADKLDTLVAFFWINEAPTGSKDPFAIRRATLSILRLILENQLTISIVEAVNRAANHVGKAEKFHPLMSEAKDIFAEIPEAVAEGKYGARAGTEMADKLLENLYDFKAFLTRLGEVRIAVVDFTLDRLKVQQREAGVRHDLIDAVFALGGEDDLVRLLARVKALQAFVETGEGANLLAGYKRAANILKKEGFAATPSIVIPAETGIQAEASLDSRVRGNDTVGAHTPLSYAPEPAESALLAALDTAEPRAAAAIEAEDFEGAMAALALLRAPIDAFFETVTVNDADPDKRTARLGMLARVRDAVHRVADFSKIEG